MLAIDIIWTYYANADLKSFYYTIYIDKGVLFNSAKPGSSPTWYFFHKQKQEVTYLPGIIKNETWYFVKKYCKK